MWLNEEALDVLVNYYYPKAKWLQINCNWGAIPYTGKTATKEINDPFKSSKKGNHLQLIKDKDKFIR